MNTVWLRDQETERVIGRRLRLTMRERFLAELESEAARSLGVLEQVPTGSVVGNRRAVDGARLPLGSGREHSHAEDVASKDDRNTNPLR